MKAIQLTESPTFETIKTYIPKGDRGSKEFIYNGKTIKAYRKFTTKGGQLNTQYLHVLIENKTYSSGVKLFSHYREDKKGDFNFIQYLESE